MFNVILAALLLVSCIALPDFSLMRRVYSVMISLTDGKNAAVWENKLQQMKFAFMREGMKRKLEKQKDELRRSEAEERALKLEREKLLKELQEELEEIRKKANSKPGNKPPNR